LGGFVADKKIIAVMGATGSQGGGLVRAIQSDPSGGFTARAITRDVNSDKAKALRILVPKWSLPISMMKRV
jgi:uncharacterized protein YbjT (DUF2867 family)